MTSRPARVLLLGGSGLLGTALRTRFAAMGLANELDAPTRAACDVTDFEALRARLRAGGYGAVVNCVALTAVDACETEHERARVLHVELPAVLAREAAECGMRLVQISTDYVFGGTRRTPYPENAPRDPVGRYGTTKAQGEQAALAAHPAGTLVARVAWLFGPGARTFSRTIVEKATAGEPLAAIGDQWSSPTYVPHAARALADLVHHPAALGIVHVVGSGAASWVDFAREAYRLCGRDPALVRSVAASTIARAAPRPVYSALADTRLPALLGRSMPTWQEGLREYLATLGALARTPEVPT